MNYFELRAAMAAKYEKNEDAVTQPSGAANLMSALNFWLRWLGKSDDSRVGNELDADFDASLSNFCSHLADRGATPTLLRDRRNHLRRWRDLAVVVRTSRDAKGESLLQHALSKAIATNSVTITELARSAKLPLSVIRNWLQGTAPNARSRPSLCRVERELGLTHNSLVALTSLDVLSTEELGKSAQTISYRVGHAKRTKQKYRLTEFPAHFHIEWKNFLVYKTCLSPTLERQTKGIWRLRPIEDATLHYRRPQFMPNSAEYCPTASIAWSMVSSFLGFIKNHKTEIYLEDSQATPKIPLSTNVQPTRISLALFTDVDLLSSYLEFMKVRAGTYTSGTLAVVQFALSPSHYTQVPASLNSLA